MLADDNLRVRAAGRAEPALASWNQPVADGLVGFDAPQEHPGAQLPAGWTSEIDSHRGYKNDGDDEHRSPSPKRLHRSLVVRTCLQTH
jgi:hypothetical protein